MQLRTEAVVLESVGGFLCADYQKYHHLTASSGQRLLAAGGRQARRPERLAGREGKDVVVERRSTGQQGGQGKVAKGEMTKDRSRI